MLERAARTVSSARARLLSCRVMDARPTADCSDARAILEGHYTRGQNEYGDFAYACDAFATRAIRSTERWSDSRGTRWLEDLRSLHGADFYLSSACDAGWDLAWARVRKAFLSRLLALLARRGAGRDDALEHVDETLADLSLPSRRPGDARRIGAYSGRGSLLSFLATLALRRRADALDRRRRATARETIRARRDRGLQHGEQVLEEALGRELAAETCAALRRGLEACTPREHLVLVLKHRDGCSQRDIALALGIGAPRVSRLCEAAYRKVGAALHDHLASIRTAQSTAAWDVVCESVRRELMRQIVPTGGSGS